MWIASNDKARVGIIRKEEIAFETNFKIKLQKLVFFKAVEVRFQSNFASQLHTCSCILKYNYTSSVFDIYFLTPVFTAGVNLREQNHNL